MRQQLRVLFETPTVRLAWQKAMERLTQDAAGKALLRDMLMPRPVKPDYGRDLLLVATALLGGHFEVQSRYGKGTSVTLWLPLQTSAAQCPA